MHSAPFGFELEHLAADVFQHIDEFVRQEHLEMLLKLLQSDNRLLYFLLTGEVGM